MKNTKITDNLIIPVYINEKIVLDMLAIMEDGFSMVSQVNYTEHTENNTSTDLKGGVSTSATILSKLLKIDITGEINHTKQNGENESVSKEKVHTNVSLLSKFRNYLISNNMIKTGLDCSNITIGDFIEVEGELQKNPLINYIDMFVDMFRMADIFSEKPTLGNKMQAKTQHQQENDIVNKMKDFAKELKHTGTIDFILSNSTETVVLSAQEKYLANDNISEILGGSFKVLGKVIAVCKDSKDSIDLLRKTTLAVLPQEMIDSVFLNISKENTYNLPEFKTKVSGPAAIVIPVAIYA